jgi:POT family proton-dependent oligopeptide transporter
MWEKFSFFGMRALLVYYMTKQLMFSQGNASLIYGGYTAFVYLTPIFGGVIADRWLGRRRAVIVGGSLMAAGHFMMAFEPLFFLALATIALGNGLFLPSLPSQVQALYAHGDGRKTRAYSLYYVGINLGAFLAPLVCGTLGETLGWHWGFGAAGIGMVLGLFVYIFGQRYIPASADRSVVEAQVATEDAAGSLRARLWLLIGIFVSVLVFRGAYEQTGNTVALWTDQGVDRAIGALTIPMTWFQALNPLLVFLLTPLLVAHWARAAKTAKEPGALVKMSTGATLAALSYALLAGVAMMAGDTEQTHWGWLALHIAILTWGELFILPVGLALFAQIGPARTAATMVAIWFLASFFGNLIAGALGSLWSGMTPAQFFLLMAGVAGASALSLFALSRLARGALTRV